MKMGIPSLNIGNAQREDEQMTENSNSKRDILGKLNIGKAVAIQQQQLQKNDQLALNRIPIRNVEDSQPKPPSLGLDVNKA